MKKYIETRTLTAENLRRTCIENDWYTCGDCEEYEALFAKLYDSTLEYVNITTEKLAEIAEDIWDHSDITDYTISTVMFKLAAACYSWFEEA